MSDHWFLYCAFACYFSVSSSTICRKLKLCDSPFSSSRLSSIFLLPFFPNFLLASSVLSSIVSLLVLFSLFLSSTLLSSPLLSAYLFSSFLYQIHRFVLGSYPKDERARLCEVLTRSLTRQIATKGVLRMRSSTGVEVHDYW